MAKMKNTDLTPHMGKKMIQNMDSATEESLYARAEDNSMDTCSPFYRWGKV